MNITHQNLLDEVPWSDQITAYDEAHFTTYMRLLDAAADDASDKEMARLILDIDPETQPQRAQKMLASHMARAKWIAETGYRDLFSGHYR